MLGKPWIVGILVPILVFWAVKTVLAFPTFLRLFLALINGSADWPGPEIFEEDDSPPRGQPQKEIKPSPLFRLYTGYTLGVLLATLISSALFYIGFTQLEFDPLLKGAWVIFLIILAFTWGVKYSARTIFLRTQVNRALANQPGSGEPQQISGFTPESEYAIDHPLTKRHDLEPGFSRAMTLFAEATRNFQDGNDAKAFSLYQQALAIHPSFHQDARTTLSSMAGDDVSEASGAVCYWSGAHSEYMLDWKSASLWYEKAVKIYAQLGYPKRESRAHCNLGNVKMHMNDASAMGEFEKAVALNPRNGTAQMNIAKVYYRICNTGDSMNELAMDAYASAILADPATYGPKVIASLREIGYTWKEDLEEITKRVEQKRMQESLKK